MPMNKLLRLIRERLQSALEMELFTIPLYLTALYSIRDGTNHEAVDVIQGVVMEEMLHMVLVANIMNAVGASPCLSPELVDESNECWCELEIREYPAPVPHLELSESGQLRRLNLERFSPGCIRGFEYLEQPKEWTGPSGPPFESIGEFYDHIAHSLRTACQKLGESAVFCGTPHLQVRPDTHYYGAGGKVIPVAGLSDALEAIHQVAEQGEGRRDVSILSGNQTRFGQPKEAAHYYRFRQISHGRYYEDDNNLNEPPRGRPLAVDWQAVHPMQSNPSPRRYKGKDPEPEFRHFDASYRELLRLLHKGLNGEVDCFFPKAIGVMHELKQQTMRLMKTPVADGHETYGPPFWFVVNVPHV